MGCLLAVTTGAIPRLLVIFMWLARPEKWDAAFGGVIVPILGIIFLPFTTLVYVFLTTPGQSFSGLDYLWLLLAVAIDVYGWGASAYSNRDKIGFASTMDN